VKQSIVYQDVSDAERVFEDLALAFESGFSTALGNLTQATAFSRCSRLEKGGLRHVLQSFSTSACAVEIRYQTGLSGNLLFVCRVSDLAGLGKLLAGNESDTGEVLSPELMESCVRFLALAASESNKLFSAKHFHVASEDPELINPDGNTASLEPLNSSYEGVLCASYQMGIESKLDCPFCLLADSQLLESLVALLPKRAQNPSDQNAADQRSSTPRQKQAMPLAHTSPEVEMGPSKPPKAGPEKASGNWNIDLLLDVELPVAVSFGECEMPLRDVLKLAAGSVIELDKSVNDPVTIIVNEKPIARGEVVMIDGNYGVRITEVESTADRIRSFA
jgi:flagellar motor switch protein FliN/FliY